MLFFFLPPFNNQLAFGSGHLTNLVSKVLFGGDIQDLRSFLPLDTSTLSWPFIADVNDIYWSCNEFESFLGMGPRKQCESVISLSQSRQKCVWQMTDEGTASIYVKPVQLTHIYITCFHLIDPNGCWINIPLF